MRKPIIAGNWKMHKTVAESLALVGEILKSMPGIQEVEVVVCPPFPSLYPAAQLAQNSGLAVGAQNMHWEQQGAYTGEVSPPMLKEAGCRYVIVGHSERRQYFAETDEMVNRKVKAAFAHSLVPILCVGETLAQREAGKTTEVVERQVRAGLDGLTAGQAASLVIAYEPVWAIGTGRTASADDANTVCGFIRRIVGAMFTRASAEAIRIQYGGSVKPENSAELMAKSDIDGALVGGASLDAATFLKIVQY